MNLKHFGKSLADSSTLFFWNQDHHIAYMVISLPVTNVHNYQLKYFEF